MGGASRGIAPTSPANLGPQRALREIVSAISSRSARNGKVIHASVLPVAFVLAVGLSLHGQASPVQPASAPRGQTAAPGGNAEAGRKLYVSYGCYQCHGYEAQGSSATGPRLGPRPIAFAAFGRYVRQPTGQMPPYTTKVVSDAELADIYAFVQTRPAPPPVQSILLLK